MMRGERTEMSRNTVTVRERDSSPSAISMRTFTKEELGHYSGENGSPAYIAYKGNVYDVTRCFLWHRGKHQALHVAGMDLTDALADAPHGEDLLERAVLVGTLVR